MSKRQIRPGDKFGALLVEERTGRIAKSVLWRCKCDCGNMVEKRSANLLGGTLSCGYSCPLSPHPCKTHRLSHTHEYKVWIAMIQRCYLTTTLHYHRYGGRGITVCQRWRDDFLNFLADMGVRPDGNEIDRINNDGNYEPSNCRWATHHEQYRNRQGCHWIEWDGRRQVAIDWEKELGLKKGTIQGRLRLGWSIERTMTTPLKKQSGWRKAKQLNGQTDAPWIPGAK